MITPNKFLTIDQSILAKLPIILERAPIAALISDLYHEMSRQFESPHQFILTLDVLYILGNVTLNADTMSVTINVT